MASRRFFLPTTATGHGLREKYMLPEKYILFTGTIEPRKNLSTLLQALLKLKHAGIVIPLVIAGSRGWGLRANSSALRNELGSQVHEIGYVDTSELPGLYRAAQLFVFPSLAEGFGLPLLEAMASGTPILCSDIPVFHEIGHDLPNYFQPTHVSELAEKISLLWQAEQGDGPGKKDRPCPEFQLARQPPPGPWLSTARSIGSWDENRDRRL